MRRISILVAGACVMLVGCGPSRSGMMLSFDQVKQFEVGTTTKAQVRSQMGEPQRVIAASADVEAWLYMYTEAEMSGSFKKTLRQYQRTATFTFSGDELADLEWSDYDSASQGFMFSGEAGKAFDLDGMKSLQKGKATPADVESQFGPAQKHVYRYDGTEIWVYVHVKNRITKTATLTFEKGRLAEVEVEQE